MAMLSKTNKIQPREVQYGGVITHWLIFFKILTIDTL